MISGNSADIKISIKNTFFGNDQHSLYGGTSIAAEDFTNDNLLKKLYGYHFDNISGSIWGKDSVSNTPTLFTENPLQNKNDKEYVKPDDNKGDDDGEESDKDALKTLAKNSAIKLAISGRTLQISGMQLGQKVRITDVQGRVLKAFKAENQAISIDMPYSAMYIVHVGNRAQIISAR